MAGDEAIQDVTIPLETLVMKTLVGNASPANALPEFRAGLKSLREAYKSKSGAPDYSERHSRGAYALAYYPHHVMAYAHMFARAGLGNLGLNGGPVRVVVLGAGPGSEILGLLHAANCLDWGELELEIALVDKEAGWKNSHPTTLARAGSQILGSAIEAKSFEILDLNTPQGLIGLQGAVSDSDLVLVPMLLSETDGRGKPGRITDAIFGAMPAKSRLVISDIATYAADDAGLASLQGMRWDCRLIWSENIVHPCQESHPDLKKYLYVPGYDVPRNDGLIRRGQIRMRTAIFSFG